MSKQIKWIAAVAAALFAAVAFFALRTGGDRGTRPGAPGGAAAPRPSASPASGSASHSQPAPPPAPLPGAPPPNAPRVMAYRPAKFLLYSEERPARSPDEDRAQPVLKRIFELTGADATQQSKILELWRVHEDGRRALWASAFPRVSGPRILDPEKLEELDSTFENSLFGILQPAQREPLARELPPPGTPRTPPPTLYADPRLEK